MNKYLVALGTENNHHIEDKNFVKAFHRYNDLETSAYLPKGRSSNDEIKHRKQELGSEIRQLHPNVWSQSKGEKSYKP